MTHDEWYAKRDAIHDIVCDYFNTGSDDGLPVGDEVMTRLFGAAPPAVADPRQPDGMAEIRLLRGLLAELVGALGAAVAAAKEMPDHESYNQRFTSRMLDALPAFDRARDAIAFSNFEKPEEGN